MPFDGTWFKIDLPTALPAHDKVGKALLLAKTRIETDGWCTYELHDGRAVCAVGAIEDVTGDEYAILRRGARRVYEWNDNPGRKQHEVVALFERAIRDQRRRKWALTKWGVSTSAIGALHRAISYLGDEKSGSRI
jgi:hypothetical protein